MSQETRYLSPSSFEALETLTNPNRWLDLRSGELLAALIDGLMVYGIAVVQGNETLVPAAQKLITRLLAEPTE